MGGDHFDVEHVFSAVLFRGAALAQRALASLRASGGDFRQPDGANVEQKWIPRERAYPRMHEKGHWKPHNQFFWFGR